MCTVSTVTVTVPGTTANLGPGFDCIGAALTLYNEFQFTRLDTPPSSSPEEIVTITVTGLEADRVNTDKTNLAYVAFVKLYEHLGQLPPPVHISINLGVPLARGLGSSATAIVGGLVGANALAGSPLSQQEVMLLAIAMEGHPDNVVPALLGGCRLAASYLETPQPPLIKGTSREERPPIDKNALNWAICEIPWDSHIVPVVAIPDFELSTAEARRVLPVEYTRADAIFNTAHFGLLVHALQIGNREWLRVALQDKIHQPYRQCLIKGYEVVQQAALASGALGLVISGAGPTLLAVTDAAAAESVATAMMDAWRSVGVNPDVRSLSLDCIGAKVHF
jgi:homoserine kinase